MVAWLTAFHIIAVIAWMAALLYLPRLFVYHAEAQSGSQLSETFKTMERRLLRFIATPAMLAAWFFGLWLSLATGAWGEGWFLVKFLCVLALTGAHGFQARWMKTFAADANVRPARYFRVANEIPTVLMIAIVILAVVKPF